MADGEHKTPQTISFFSLTLFLGAFRLLYSFTIYYEFRQLVNALGEIIKKIKTVLMFFVLAVVYYANITYVEKMYEDQGYFNNFISSYDYAFGNWGYKEENKTLQWTYFMHIAFSFLFGIIITNILISLVSEVYEELKNNEHSVENTLKAGLILKAIELRMHLTFCCKKREPRRGMRLFV